LSPVLLERAKVKKEEEEEAKQKEDSKQNLRL